jgi:hypothetical protein
MAWPRLISVSDITDIQTALAAATTLGLTPAQMVELCDVAAAALLAGRRAATQIGSTTLTFHNLAVIKGVREYYAALADAADTPACLAQAEF